MVRPSDELIKAAQLMRERHIGYLVVVEASMAEGGWVPVGVLTDRDIVVTVVAQGADARALRVGDVMTRKPATVLAEDSVADALGEMRRVGVRRLPVLGEGGTVCGVISMDDVLTALAQDLGNAAAAITRERNLETELRP
jgi:CBS domain-containing protein